jgi:hypothetical protein
MLHIGNLIRQVFLSQGRSIKWFAEKLNCDRTNIYKIFRKEKIDTDLLQHICVILEHDFFLDISNVLRMSKN